MSTNEQGLAKSGDLKNIKPVTATDGKTNVQDKLQKFIDLCQARAETDSEQMLKLTTSCHACTTCPVFSGKSLVSCCFLFFVVY